MFELESKKPDEITITTKKTSVNVNVAQGKVDAGLEVGAIEGPGEFEIGDVAIRAIAVGGAGDAVKGSKTSEEGDAVSLANRSGALKEARVIYDVEVGGVHIGIIGEIEEGLDDLGMASILCTSSVRAVREIEPKLVVATGNVDGMVTELKLSARTEKKLKVKNAEALPAALEVVVLT